jgi:hypothetical protein
MHDSGRLRGRRRRVGLLLAVVAATIVTGCGGGSPAGVVTHGPSATPSNSGGAATSATVTKPPPTPSPLAFAKCMRAHGVPNYPDPVALGRIASVRVTQAAPSGGFTANPNSPAYRSASNDCRPLADAQRVTQAGQTELLAAQLKFAVCMRAHGVPNFQDPTSSGEIGDNGATGGVNPSSPAFEGAEEQCSKLRPLPPGLPRGGPPVTAPGG